MYQCHDHPDILYAVPVHLNMQGSIDILQEVNCTCNGGKYM